ncbi:TD and POZ domain-containing protein 3-like [Argiope bruennichi]|uniref:TD and POZ domain-containing protein 3-like n=1 Tax=Argiope bruennichi TaxID=94029 RepID=UPI0024954A2C|nr:TD and POZ domain-containing protein 3-like [Argiope bruennichi]
MATKIDDKINGYTFVWKIENISHCWLKTGECIASPAFITDALDGTKWSLLLYPMGYIDKNHVSFYLHRKEDCTGPIAVKVNFQLSFLGKDGSVLTEVTVSNWSFMKKNVFAHPIRELHEKVFITEKESFLPDDTLTVQCTIWNKKETLLKPKLISARTVFKVNRKVYIWKIDQFTISKDSLRNKFRDDLIAIDFILSEGLSIYKLDVDIISFAENTKYFSFKISRMNAKGEKEMCGIREYFACDLKKGTLSTVLIKNLEKNAHSLLFECEFVSSNGTVLNEICSCGIISPKVTTTAPEKVKSPNTSAVINALKSMYEDGSFHDIELRTSKRVFPAHKNILSARSPVFKRMLVNDMKEKNSGHIDIIDLEEDAIHQMLLYMYTDILEDLHFESACKLYAAADKYEILSLMSRCSTFLKDNLCPTEACEVLTLADRHHDDDLKHFVQDYILKKDTEVFGLREWKLFMDANPKLAADIMYLKVFPG